jgi:predicted kinase
VRKQATSVPLVLIITGAPASGKSTLGPRLASALGLPYLSKDLFKESLFETLGVADRAWSQRLGIASIQLLFKSTAALLEAGQSVAVESNFYTRLSTPEFQGLAERYGCRFIQVVCTASGPTLVERFARRVVSGERHPGHADAETLAEWRTVLLEQHWDAVDLPGPVLTVNTEGDVDVEALVTRLQVLNRGATPD